MSTNSSSSAEHVLDNPVWWSLQGEHSSVALTAGAAARYPRDMTPFIAVEHPGVESSACTSIVSEEEEVFFLGVAPRFGSDWEVRQEYPVHQYVVERSPFESALGAHLAPLGPDDIPKLCELASRAYPYFFRSRTALLGPYYAVERHGEFVAMGGERMRVQNYREISAVCSLPGRIACGFGIRVFDRLLRSICEAGDKAFFHCVEGNDDVIEMVHRAGGRIRNTIPMWRVCYRPGRS